MNERPILFNTSMVQSVRADIKLETRRIVKGTALEWLMDEFTPDFVASSDNDLCKYGKVGDVLWVRETFTPVDMSAVGHSKDEYMYLADFEFGSDKIKWKPSIFMPCEACRERLEITDIGIERVNNISDEDAINEGVFFDEGSGFYFVKNSDIMGQSAKDAYRSLWQKINGSAKPVMVKKEITHYICYPWSDEFMYKDAYTYRGKPLIQVVNPWVWVIRFKRLPV